MPGLIQTTDPTASSKNPRNPADNDTGKRSFCDVFAPRAMHLLKGVRDEKRGWSTG